MTQVERVCSMHAAYFQITLRCESDDRVTRPAVKHSSFK